MEIRKTRQLWGKEFDVVDEGLAEEQVTAFVNDLLRQHDTLVQLLSSLQKLTNLAQDLEGEWSSKTLKAEKTTAPLPPGVEAALAQMAQQRLKLSVPSPGETKDSIADQVVMEEPSALRQGTSGPVSPVPEGEKPVSRESLEEVGVEGRKSDNQKADVPVAGADSDVLYTGEVELVLAPRLDLVVVSEIHKCLEGTSELEIVRSAGSWERGTTITVLTGKAMPLVGILSQISMVEVEAEGSEEDAFLRELGGSGGGRDKVLKRVRISSKGK